MSWSIGYDATWERDIGYGVPAFCDHPKCSAEIDRGLAYVCGGEPYGGERGCGLFFCPEHLKASPQLCPRCAAYRAPYTRPKPEHPRWVAHKLGDPSWASLAAGEPGRGRRATDSRPLPGQRAMTATVKPHADGHGETITSPCGCRTVRRWSTYRVTLCDAHGRSWLSLDSVEPTDA